MPSKYSLTTLKLIIIIILLGLYYSYFFKGVIRSYGKGLTNLASTEEKIEATNVPAIIICMRPAWKKSVLEKYNTTEAFFQMTESSYEHLIEGTYFEKTHQTDVLVCNVKRKGTIWVFLNR